MNTPTNSEALPLTNCSALVQHLPKGVKTRPTRRSLSRFAYFAECDDDKRLPEIPMDANGWTAAECFHVHETFGHLLPCKDPVMLTRALNGKQWHGLTVTNCAEDYIGRLLFAFELKANYPEWVRQDILGRARQLAQRDLGYVPKFVLTGEDFTTKFVLTGEDFTTLDPLLNAEPWDSRRKLKPKPHNARITTNP